MLSLTDIDKKTVVIRQVVFLLFFLSFRQQFEYFFLAKRVKCSVLALTVCFLVMVPSEVARLCISLRSSSGGEAINITYGINSGVLRIFKACRQTKGSELDQIDSKL